ncbi:prepilin-type N-terminal cleavage/methylation domain-containing protein [Kribbella qitaiheensis]|uniref:Prepilin-type N-terminal cleavage/methylation domain-containing protein n=1 Tax=Kribbella qitaiheensis TaxID=1544730 RepID=A0A7G6WWG4_9ACTN|nr:prepilin-type N-terminal cleavage/methylation domain-containing protein [Kribbella qitaiheensis]QNE18329.1 prepilin-type N-terminal cleavage/methylation domain-containing protein [Kribbella qitaiheensis]
MLQQLRSARKNESGFTLIELLIVIVILGVLSGIVVFAVQGINDRGNAAACKTDKSSVITAVEAYYAKTGSYPADYAALTTAPNQFLRAAPTATMANGGYVITLGASDGTVTASGACT